jgi:hypothetical protein
MTYCAERYHVELGSELRSLDRPPRATAYLDRRSPFGTAGWWSAACCCCYCETSGLVLKSRRFWNFFRTYLLLMNPDRMVALNQAVTTQMIVEAASSDRKRQLVITFMLSWRRGAFTPPFASSTT